MRTRNFSRLRLIRILIVAALLFPTSANAENEKHVLTARHVTAALFNARNGQKPSFANKDLRRLDLANLDFSTIDLSGADLFGADLSNARLQGSVLRGARLDRATITRARFTGADLQGATILRPNIFSTLEANPGERPSFDNANLSRAHLSGDLRRVRFRGANLSGSIFGAKDPRSEELITARVELRGCDFSGANLQGAVLRNNAAPYANFSNANLRQANLVNSNLTMADFRGADIAGADFTGSILDDAKFDGALGLQDAIGLDPVDR